MFELPELVNLADQLRATVPGKVIAEGSLGNSPHKFVWYNRSPEEFRKRVAGRTVGEPVARGRWLLIPVLPGQVLALGEFGGHLLYHPPDTETPAKYHLFIRFADGSSLSVMTQMWGAMELFDAGEELKRDGIRDMKPSPIDQEFTLLYFRRLVELTACEGKRSAKALLTQHQLIPGIGNSTSQEILFRAGIDPRHLLEGLDRQRVELLYDAIVDTVREAIAAGGSSDEVDLYGHHGGFVRTMRNGAEGSKCPLCGELIGKFQYLGGTCYVCPHCQT